MSYNDCASQNDAWLRPVTNPDDPWWIKLKKWFGQKHVIKECRTIELAIVGAEISAFVIAYMVLILIYIYPPTVTIVIVANIIGAPLYFAYEEWHRRYMRRIERGY